MEAEAMLTRILNRFVGGSSRPTQIAWACAAGLLLGAACLLVSPELTLVGLAGLALSFAMLKRPEIGVLAILLCTAGVISEAELPLIPIGVGSLQIPDVFLLSLLGMIGLRWLVEPEFKLVRTPLDLPLLAFWGIAVSVTFIGVFRSTVDTTEALRGIRFITYYLTFFVVTNLAREERQIRLLLWGSLLLGTITAAAMAGQAALGDAMPLMRGRVETLTIQGTSYAGVTRIVVPGLSLVVVGFVVVTVTLVLNKFKAAGALSLLQWALLGLGVVLTFLRSYWAVIAFLFLLLAYLVRGRDRWRMISGGLAAALLGAIVLLTVLTSPDTRPARLVGATFDRLLTLVSADTAQEDSLEWRYMENRYAYRQILAHPLLGLGLRARYRPSDPVLERSLPPDPEWDARRHIHNGHLGMLVTTGLPGYLTLMGFSLVFIVRGFKRWRSVRDPQLRGMVLGYTLAYLGVVIGAIVNATFMQWYWTPVIGTMMAMNEVVYRQAL